MARGVQQKISGSKKWVAFRAVPRPAKIGVVLPVSVHEPIALTRKQEREVRAHYKVEGCTYTELARDYSRCRNAVECRGRVKNMTIPARGWLLLRRVTGKRLPRRSDEEICTGSGAKKKAFF